MQESNFSSRYSHVLRYEQRELLHNEGCKYPMGPIEIYNWLYIFGQVIPLSLLNCVF